MKQNFIIALALVFITVSCNEKKGDVSDDPQVHVLADSAEVDNTGVVMPESGQVNPSANKENEVVTVKGTVVEVEPGKDGYTARITDENGFVYYAVISIPNLEDSKQFREVKENDKITVTGETWVMEGIQYIKASELE